MQFDGTTYQPLMEAALWGGTKIVQHLITRSTSKDITDRSGRGSMDLAQES